VGPEAAARIVMIRRSTLIVIAVFVILVGAVIVIQRVEENQVDEVVDLPVADTPKPIRFFFELPEGETILGLTLKDEYGKSVEIQRQSEASDWVLVLPDEEADNEVINQVITQLTTLQIDSALETDLELSVVGLDAPAYTIRLTLSSGKKVTAYIGDLTVADNSYYARLAGGGPVILSKYTVDQVVNLVNTPPILPTPIPTVEPIESDE
jgi:hypothetical protein